MGILSNIFSPKNSETLVEGVYKGLDMTFYTDEEKAIALQSQVDTKLKLLPLYEPFKLAQRFIAISMTINFIILLWSGVIMYILFPEYLEGFLKLMEIFNIGWIMTTIIVWYFTGGIIQQKPKEGK